MKCLEVGVFTKALINLVEKEKKFIFDQYAIQVTSVYFEIYTEHEQTNVLLNGDVIATTPDDDYSFKTDPYILGIYTFGAKYSSESGDLETETTQANIDPNLVNEVYLYFES